MKKYNKYDLLYDRYEAKDGTNHTIMQALSAENILRLPITEQVFIDHSTVAYIQQLVLPYAQAIDGATDAQGILAWLPQVFTGVPLEILTDAFRNVIMIYNPTPEKVTEGLDIMIGALITHIIVLGMDAINKGNENDITLYPWDIQLGISLQEDTAPLFTINTGDNTLPVDITIGPNKSTHMLTKEFVAGLCLFSVLEEGNLEYKIVMFESIIEPDHMLMAAGFYMDSEHHLFKFKVVVSDKTYGFNTPDFMQGFSTGAMWANVDHHLYWKNLVEIEKIGDEVKEFPISF